MMGSWEKVRLGDLLNKISQPILVEPTKEYNILGMHLYARGLYIKAVKKGSSISAKKLFKVKTGDFVYNRLFAWKGSFGIVTDASNGCCVSNEFPCFEVDSAKLDVRFLHLYFSQEPVWRKALGLSSGSTPISRNRLKEDKFLSMIIPLPSFPEQRRIVARIEELTDKIEEAKGLKKEAVEEAESLLSTGLNIIFVKGKKSGWSETTISNVCEQPQYGYTESAVYEPVGPKFLRITDIQNGYVDWDTVPYCRCPQAEKYHLCKGDILFARSGATTGKSYLVKECPQAVFASYLIRVRVKNNIMPELLYWFFQSPLYWTQVIEQKSGSAQPNMNGKKLSNLKTVFPEELEEQRRIVAYLDNLQAKTDKLKHLQLETQSELDALIPSILAKAFRGKL